MRTTTRTAFLTTGGVLLLLALSACGGSTSSDTSSAAVPASSGAASGAASPAGGAGGRPDFTAYRDCMATNGVTLPDFRQGGGTPPSGMPSTPPSGAPSGAAGAGGPGAFPLPSGVDQATYDKAQTACASLRPQFGGAGGAGGPGQIDQTALAAFKSCLGDHDVTVPNGQDWMRQLDRTDAKVSAALKTCSPLLPQPGAAPTASAAASSN